MSTTTNLAPSIVTVTSTKTTNASNTTAHVPIFRITGTVRILKLYGIVGTVLSSNHTAASFRLNDQTAQIQITSVAGTAASAAPVGTTIQKTGLAALAVSVDSAAAGAIREPTAAETVVQSEFDVVAKNGANTDIEYNYTTTNTPATGSITFVVEYQSLNGGTVTPI